MAHPSQRIPTGPRTRLTYGLISNPTKCGARELIEELISRLGAHGWEPLCDEATHSLLDSPTAHPAVTAREIAEKADLIIVLGGDGTLLRAIQTLHFSPKPLAAINTGRLGFLSTGGEEDQDRFIRSLLEGDYTLSRRSTLEVEFTRLDGIKGTAVALNECSLTRGMLPRMIHLEARLDGALLNFFSGDGVIVATPTGSTAYSLSAGGPIVGPDAQVFVVTPICSHALGNRAVVVSDGAVLQFAPANPTDDLLLTTDGQNSVRIAPREPVTIRRSPTDVTLVRLPGHNFYDLLHHKLGWSGSVV